MTLVLNVLYVKLQPNAGAPCRKNYAESLWQRGVWADKNDNYYGHV